MPKKRKPSKPSPKPAPAKRKVGRPEGGGFKPTAEQRNMVLALAGYVIPEREIAMLVINPETRQAITPVTLRKHFREELDTGFAKLKVRHHMALFKNVENGNVTAQIWWDKTRNGIREHIGLGIPAPLGATEESQERHSMLEIARRVAFVLSMGAEAAKPSAPSKPAPQRHKEPA